MGIHLRSHLTNWAGIRRENKVGGLSTTTGGIVAFSKAKGINAVIKFPCIQFLKNGAC